MERARYQWLATKPTRPTRRRKLGRAGEMQTRVTLVDGLKANVHHIGMWRHGSACCAYELLIAMTLFTASSSCLVRTSNHLCRMCTWSCAYSFRCSSSASSSSPASATLSGEVYLFAGFKDAPLMKVIEAAGERALAW